MADADRVVVRYKDGRVLKGTTSDFTANRPFFRLLNADGNEALAVKCDSLKAVFFVKDFQGNPMYDERPEFLHSPDEGAKGKKVAVRFKDGEVVFGYTTECAPHKEGFFLTPADPHSNNQRIWVVASATEEVIAGPAADAIVVRTVTAAPR